MGNRLSKSQKMYKNNRSLIVNSKDDGYVYDEDGRFLISDSEYTYDYDIDGFLTKKTEINDNTNYWQYIWNAAGNLIKVEKYINNTLDFEETYLYDESGIRVKTINSEATTVYIYDGSSLIYEKTIKSEDTVTKDYVYALGELQSVIETKNETEKKTTFYYSDILGSTRFITSESGNVIQETICTPFGNELINTHKTPDKKIYYKFAGHDGKNEKTGLTYMHARWMDNDAGRFISPDPAKDGLNYYAYAGNNPVTGSALLLIIWPTPDAP